MTQSQQMQGSDDAYQKAKAETKKLTEPKIPPKKFTLLNILIFGTFGGGIFIVLYFFYLLFWPFNPLTINSVKVITPSVKVGGAMVYDINSCKKAALTPTVYRKIVSSASAEALTTSPGVLSTGCSNKTVPVTIPTGTIPGTYTLYTEVVYHVNAVRDVHVFWQAGPFLVVTQ